MPTKRDNGTDPRLIPGQTIVGFRAPGEPSPQDTVLGTGGASPGYLPFDVLPPPVYNQKPRTSTLSAGFSNASNIASMSSVSAGPAASALVSHTSLPQPATTTAADAPLAATTPPATASAPNSPPSGSPVSSLKQPPHPEAPAAAAPSAAALAAMSKSERKAYYEAVNQHRTKEPAAKLTKEERRAKQEAERAEKAKTAKGPAATSAAFSTSSAKTMRSALPTKPAPTHATAAAAAAASTAAAVPPADGLHEDDIVSHLQPSLNLEDDAVLRRLMGAGYHRAIVHLGYRYKYCKVVGGTARTRTMLNALKVVVDDYECPKGKEPSRDIAAHITHQVGYLAAVRRPLGLHMGNAVRHLKAQIGKLRPDMPEADVKTTVIALIDKFLEERMRLPLRQIIERAAQLIEPGEHIVTYCKSEAVLKTLVHAHKAFAADASMPSPPFTVGVVDNCETWEGREMVRMLRKNGVSAEYTCSISLAAGALSLCTKVFLGAAAVLANGAVYTRSGAAALAVMCNNIHIPVVVLCEAFKFHEHSQVTTSEHNELGDFDKRVLDVPEHQPRPYKPVEEDACAYPVSGFALRYSLIPHQFVEMIVCEAAAVPPAGAVAQMRRMRKDVEEKQVAVK